MGKDIRFEMRLTDADNQALESLAAACDTSKAEALRLLIPSPALAEATLEARRCQGTSLQTSATFGKWAFVAWMEEEMRNDPDHPIADVQLAGRDWDGTAKVFIAFCRARRGEAGYRFEKVRYGGKDHGFIVREDPK